MALSQEEQDLAVRIGFDENVLEQVKASADCSFQQLRAQDEDGGLEDKPALLVLVAEQKSEKTFDVKLQRLEELSRVLNTKINSLGYKVFLLMMSSEPALFILRAEDQFEALRTFHTNGDNYEVSNADVLAKLQSWNSSYGINIVGVKHDVVALTFEKLPDNLLAFAQEVYEFCPDIIDQGYASEAEDSDENIEELLELHEKAHLGQVTGEELMARIQELQPSIDDREQLNQRALKMLADNIEESRSLFLWWD